VIPLPEGLKVKRNAADERLLLDAARKWIDKDERKPGLHATDFLDLRQAYWRAVDPRPTADRVVPIFLVGKVLHSFVLGTLEGQVVDLNVTDEGSSYEEEIGFWYSPDWDKGDIAEFKSSRAFKEPTDVGGLETYIEQILVYMVAKRRTSAKLWVLYLNLKDSERRTSPEFRAYTISVTEEELSELRKHLRELKESLERAISVQDWRQLPLCREFKCGRGRCDWYDQCQPEGRFGTERFDGEVPDSPEVPRSPKPKAGKGKRRKLQDPGGVPVLGSFTEESRDGEASKREAADGGPSS